MHSPTDTTFQADLPSSVYFRLPLAQHKGLKKKCCKKFKKGKRCKSCPGKKRD